jgi:Tfp pilus assembly protein PilZ
MNLPELKFQKYNIFMTKLFNLIIGLNEEQQRYLLKKADDLIFREKRSYSRKSCRIPVAYANSRRTYRGFIIDISRNGCFIETQKPFYIGEQVTVAIKMVKKKSLIIKGKVVHANRSGIGIEFRETDINSSKMISNFLRKIH